MDMLSPIQDTRVTFSKRRFELQSNNITEESSLWGINVCGFLELLLHMNSRPHECITK